LEGARDWAVSRQRYWGAPLPIWKNPETKEYKIFGSLKELQKFVPTSGNKYLIMRHGEATSNLEGRISAVNHEDDPLTEKGIEQVRAVAKELPDIDMIVHSGFLRTRNTAELVAEELGLSKEAIVEEERIKELQAGADLEGQTWAEYQEEFGTELASFTEVRDGRENRFDVIKRAAAALYDLEEKYKDKKILIVGHASSLFGLMAAAQGMDEKKAQAYKKERGFLDNAELCELDFVPLPHNDNYILDYHRPYIDEVELYEGEVKLERIPDVFDCWFESGSMPYAQHHYPFENEADFEKKHFPAQFIAEGLDQTRGWFYSLIVLGTALFGKSPFENVIVNGLALAEDGKKMSKSLQNYPDPMELVARNGADAMRFYLMSSPIIRGEDLNFSEKETAELQRKNIGRLHNVLTMYEQYNEDVEPSDSSENVLDKWILSRLNQLITESTEGYKNYELDKAVRPITSFIDDLSVWYLRRSRERLKGDDIEDKKATLATMRFVFRQLALVMAPVMPFYAEYLWQQVKTKDDQESVHLGVWPEAGKIHAEILETMNKAREIVTRVLELRVNDKIKVRQPLKSVTGPDLGEVYHDIIKEEVNVKEYQIGEDEMIKLDTEIDSELKAEGDVREFVRALQDMRKNMGLLPQDIIELNVQTSAAGEAILKKFETDISKTVGTNKISFIETSGQEVTAGEHSFVVEVKKL
ncbi:class I tRNA ligase family protein, partial [Candidatus Kaiserbacteria bacterium]|nr:class I tRNA ligase family protein [Candidatus Kaiserbacteria bacterium]